jgi:hypothetical protein
VQHVFGCFDAMKIITRYRWRIENFNCSNDFFLTVFYIKDVMEALSKFARKRRKFVLTLSSVEIFT